MILLSCEWHFMTYFFKKLVDVAVHNLPCQKYSKLTDILFLSSICFCIYALHIPLKLSFLLLKLSGLANQRHDSDSGIVLLKNMAT